LIVSVIANTTVISNFASIGRLDLLRQLYGTLHISTEVYREIQVGLEEGYQIAIAQHRGWYFLTDDLVARRQAVQLGVHVSGSVGCLVLAVERGLCPPEQANDWLQQMLQQGYWHPLQT
jgi:predicted nucleic acid-binding protein